MSEVTKPAEEPVVAPTTEAATETPAVEPTAETKAAETVEPTTETPAVAEPAKEEAAAVKEEVKPVEEGTLGYKGPGLLKGLIFQKKFFYFGTEPVENKHLSSYLRGEKDTAAANHNAAWASHTGKGLLFFSKKASDKATPAGLFNLSDVTDITEEGTTDFHFTSGGHKHTFQAALLAERDNWVSVLKTKVEEAKALVESVKESEEYKKSHSALTKPVVTAAAPPAAKKEETKEEKKEEKAEAKEEKKEAKEEKKEEKKEIKEEKKEEKKARKSRSASRKRTSLFGGINFGGKKEEKAEQKEAAKEETPAAPATEEPVAPVEATPAVEPVVAAEATEPTTTTEETVPATETKPAPTKRNSIFGQLQSRFSSQKKPEAEAPAVPAKDAEPTEPVSETAPVIPAVESTEPLAASVESPATVPTETTTVPATNGEAKTETPVTKTDKRKSSLPWLNKKEKPTSDEEGEKPKSPFAKLRATVKGKSSPKAEKVEKTPETKTEEPETAAAAESAPAAATTEEPVVSEPVPAVQTTTPQVAASA